MSDDPLDDLSRRLFSAGHVERPSDDLRERLLGKQGLGERPAGELVIGRDEGASPAAGKRRTAAVRWLLAAAVLAGSCWVLQQVLQRDSVTSPLISAERVTPTAPAIHRAPAEQAAPDPRPSLPHLAERAEPEPRPTAPPARRGSGQVKPSAAAAPSSSPASSDVGTHGPTSAARSSAPRATLAEELEWLKRARSALRAGDSGRALELLDAYDKELGGSDLRDEASVLRIEALAAAGRHAEARGLAERFTSQNPNSPLVDRARTFAGRSETAPEPGKRAEP